MKKENYKEFDLKCFNVGVAFGKVCAENDLATGIITQEGKEKLCLIDIKNDVAVPFESILKRLEKSMEKTMEDLANAEENKN